MVSVIHCLRKTSLALSAALLLAAPTAQAVGFGDMFNPGRWFGGNDDGPYYGDPYGPYGPSGPGVYGAPGFGAYGGYDPYWTPGYGAPSYDGQVPGYGAPGYAPPAPSASSRSAPSARERSKEAQIEALKRRIEQLESRGAPGNAPQPPQGRSGDGWPAAPAFRPMDQY